MQKLTRRQRDVVGVRLTSPEFAFDGLIVLRKLFQSTKGQVLSEPDQNRLESHEIDSHRIFVIGLQRSFETHFSSGDYDGHFRHFITFV
jgi:hypothetical protein